MIVFDLACDAGHRFEGWFRNTEDFTKQIASGLLLCPHCGSKHVVRQPNASHINFNKKIANDAAPTISATQLQQQISDFINQNFEDVGREFHTEALKMHYGEIEKRNIRGETTLTEATQLKEEGIDIYHMPGMGKNKLH
jgi:hypothetical protein